MLKMRLCLDGLLRLAAMLLAVLAAQPILASEFTVRLPATSSAGEGADIFLFETCDSWQCGRVLLGSGPQMTPRLVLRAKGAGGGSVIARATQPEPRDSWWVVLEPDGGLPLAMPWRPPLANGHLPPPPFIEKSSCLIEVTNQAEHAIGGALAAPVLKDPPPALRLPKTDFPALFPAWRPWLPPRLTDHDGKVALGVPTHGSVNIHVSAAGYRSQAVPCQTRLPISVRLAPTPVVTFRVVDHLGQPLREALARDHLGTPLSISDAQGNIDLDENAAKAAGATIWFETANGAVYEAERQAPDILTAVELSRVRAGVVQFESATERAPTRTRSSWMWRQPKWPWAGIHPQAATPLVHLDREEYRARVLPGEELWFAATGTGYAACPDPHLDPTERAGSAGSACPTLQLAPRIEGVVVDEVGTPLPDAELHLEWPLSRGDVTIVSGTRRHMGSALTRSDSSGRFVGDHVPMALMSFGPNSFSGRRVNVERPGYLPVRDESLDEFASEEDVYRIVLRRGATVWGRVVDASTGAPIAGAEVGLGRFRAHGNRSVVLGPLEVNTGMHGKQVRTARSEISGEFAMNAWPGRHDLVVRAPGKAFFMTPNLRIPATGLDLGDIGLGAEHLVRGVVLDPDGRPLPEATVWAAGSTRSSVFAGPPPGTGSRSGFGVGLGVDAQGRFLVSGLSAGSSVDLQVSAPGFATQRLSDVPSEHDDLIQVTLAPEAVIAGRVTWHGEGVVTRVDVLDEEGRSVPFPTDDVGAFRTSGLAAGRFDLIAHPPGAQVLVSPRAGQRLTLLSDAANGAEDVRTSVTVPSGGVVEVELELGVGDRQLFGRVVERGVGLPSVAIRVAGLDAMTDAEGRYSIAGLPAGLAFVTADRGRGGSGEGEALLRKTVVIGSQSQRLDFDFSSYEVSGRAVLGDGSPAAGAPISFRAVADNDGNGGRAMTGPDGTFALRLPQGEYLVTTQQGGNWVQSRNTVRVRKRASRVVVRFGRSLRVTGTIYGLSSQEVAQLQVEAVNDRLAVRDGEAFLAGAAAGAVSFSISGLDSGRWTVVATVGNSTRRAERKVLLDQTDERIELAFERLNDLRGTVLLDGQPLSGTLVLLAADGDLASARGVWTRYDGSFRFPDLADGTYGLAVGAETQTLTVRQDSDLTIDLRSGRLEGFALDTRTGQALAGATVHVWPMLTNRERARALGVVRTTFVDDRGQFGLDRLPEGVWALAVDGVRGMRRVDVTANVAVQITVP